MRGHIVRSLVLGSVAAVLLAVGPVAAKIPYFTIDVSPADPVDGDVVVITMHMWDDAGHTQPATWSPGLTLDGLIELRGPSGRVQLTLVQLDDVTYSAEVTLSAGTWRVVAFPGGMAGAGYPQPLTVTVGSLAADSAGSAARGIAAGGALGVAAVALLLVQRRRSVAR
jgi:hypothetical protein